MNITQTHDISIDMVALFNTAMMRIFGANTNLMLIPQTGDMMTSELIKKKNAYLEFLKENNFIEHNNDKSMFVLLAITGIGKERDKFLKNVREFINKMEVQINPSNRNIEVTLHDRIRRGTIVDRKKSIDGGIIADPSYHCESLKLFVAILLAGSMLNQPILLRNNHELTFKFSKGFFGSGSGLLKSVKKCSGEVISADKDPVRDNIYKFNISNLTEYSDKAAEATAAAEANAAAATVPDDDDDDVPFSVNADKAAEEAAKEAAKAAKDYADALAQQDDDDPLFVNTRKDAAAAKAKAAAEAKAAAAEAKAAAAIPYNDFDKQAHEDAAAAAAYETKSKSDAIRVTQRATYIKKLPEYDILTRVLAVAMSACIDKVPLAYFERDEAIAAITEVFNTSLEELIASLAAILDLTEEQSKKICKEITKLFEKLDFGFLLSRKITGTGYIHILPHNSHRFTTPDCIALSLFHSFLINLKTKFNPKKIKVSTNHEQLELQMNITFEKSSSYNDSLITCSRVVQTTTGGRSRRKSKYKSNTTHRHKHRRKTHHKHTRKTRGKRKHRSRTARKHKKYSRRR